MDKSKIYYLTRENWDMAELNAVTETYFTDPEYLKAKHEINRGKGYITEETAAGQTYWHAYWEHLRVVRNRFYYAVEIALALPEDNAFLFQTDIKDLAFFVKAREMEITEIIDRYRREKGAVYSGYHDPEAVKEFDKVDTIYFRDPEEPDPNFPPPGRAVSNIHPAPGGISLQEYPPFLELVNEFKEGIRTRRPIYAQEGEETHKTHIIAPRTAAMLHTEKNRKEVEQINTLISAGGYEGKYYLQANRLELGKVILNANLQKWDSFSNFLNTKQRRVFFGLANYANSAPDAAPWYSGKEIAGIEVAADLETLVRYVYPCEGKSGQQIKRHTKELINIIREMVNAPAFEKVTVFENEKRETEGIDINMVRPIDRVKFEFRKRGGRVTYSIYKDKIAFFIPKEAQKLKKDSDYSLCMFLYIKRNETQNKGIYYLWKGTYKVADLLTEARQEETLKSNPREARKRLKECLESLKKERLIKGYTPDKIPTDPAAEMEITFPDDKNFNSVSRYTAKQKEAKNE